ncbi:MAG: AAA family ATPase, partial [Saprospiraceae bacterium]
ADPYRNSEQYGSLEEAVEKIRARKNSENARFLKKYGADCGNMANFDLVIDTTEETPESVADRILQALHHG